MMLLSLSLDTELAITSAGVLTFVEAPDYETKAVIQQQ